jgi:hypothetical protein
MRFWRPDDTLHRQMDELRERNAQLHAQNAAMRETIDTLRQQVSELQQQIIDDNHAIIDHFAARAGGSPVFSPPLVTAPAIQSQPHRPHIEDIAERETRNFYKNHRIAGLGVPLTNQAAPEPEMAHNEQ